MSQKLILTTSWDDGHPLDLRVAELLTKYGLKGTFYVPLENSRLVLSPAQVRELSCSFEIGAHTVHHSVLTTLAADAARQEIVLSKARLEELTSKPCAIFCFPKGRFSDAHIAMVAEAGFSGARTAELLSLERPRMKHGVAVMPTTVQAFPHKLPTYLRNAAKRFRPKALWALFRCYRGADWGSTAIALLCSAQRTGGVFHLWGHSWEIEEYRQWAALDRVFAAMAEVARSGTFVTNSELCRNGR